MEVSRIVNEIDAEIDRLQQARALLAGVSAIATPGKAKRGRPKGSINRPAAKTAAKAGTKAKRTLSPEGRKRIAEAMKRRWAARKKEENS